ncbi:GBF1 [Bugula neritina]|uniref:GBF1 n=1 Tax=Bugula neritina TaxID=10212 RepID=A0A7J7KN01_BUGNE|nr:GBF1 [Bugula neritina]
MLVAMDELQPANALYLVQGEISCIVTEMKRSIRSSSHSPHEENPLISCFTDLRDTLHNTKALSEIEPIVFLSPFLELVRSEETTGRITGLALTSINKFIAYGFIDCKSRHGAAAVESIADAVTHARFVGTDPESDEVVLMKILYVLRTLLLSPSGSNLTNESVCEIMQSCFRICFETRLSKLLRRTADHILVELVQLLFSRLPQFKEDAKWAKNMKKLTMRASGMQKPRKNKHSDSRPEATAPTLDTQGPALSASGDTSGDAPGTASSAPGDIPGDTPGDIPEAEPSESPRDDNVELSDHGELEDDNSGSETHMVDLHEGLPAVRHDSQADLNDAVDDVEDSGSSVGEQDDCIATLDFINPKGIRFIPKKEGPIVPYGLPAIRELFRFLVSIMNPTDRQNSDEMSYMGIYLLTIALETAYV